jgi:hypothetical protein
MKKGIIMAVTAALPFLLVWAAAILTAFSFNPINVFQDGNFWGLSVMYWLLWVCLSPLIYEMIDISKKS